jgi:hypothetical protein
VRRCGALAATSYPEATVVATIINNFVPMQIDTSDEANASLVAALPADLDPRLADPRP